MASATEPATSRTVSKEEHQRRWFVLAATFLVLLINAALSYHVGVLNVAVTESFEDAGEQTISWLMAIYGSLFALAGWSHYFIFDGVIVMISYVFDSCLCVSLYGVIVCLVSTIILFLSFSSYSILFYILYSLGNGERDEDRGRKRGSERNINRGRKRGSERNINR